MSTAPTIWCRRRCCARIANIDSFEPGTNMSAWLFTILRNLFRSEYRKRRREVEDGDGGYAASLKSPPEQPGRIEFEEFRTALATLPPDQREALILVGRARLLLRGGGGDLRLRGRDDQEPGQSRPHPPGRAARDRERRDSAESAGGRGHLGRWTG